MSRNERKRNGREKGSTLLLVFMVGIVATLMTLAVMDSLVEAYRNIARRIGTQEVSGAAESAAQYAIARINSEAAQNGGSVDAILNVPLGIPSEVSNNLISSPIIPTKLSVPESSDTWSKFQESAIYDSVNPSFDYVQVNVFASNGVDKSGLKVILGPDGYGKKLPTGKNSFFNNAIFSSDSTSIGPGVSVGLPPPGSMTPEQLAKYFSQEILKSNGTLELNGNSVSGSISGVDGITNNGTDPNIDGNVHTSSAPDGLFNPEVNVLGDGKNDNQIPGVIDNQVSPSELVPAPTPESNGPANVDTNSNTISIPTSSDPNGVYNLGSSLVLGNYTTMTLNPGNYVADSISMGTGSKIVVNNPTSGQGVNIYVTGSTPGENSISIAESGISYALSPSITSLQLYYNGSKNISLNLDSSHGFSNFSGLIFAPKSKVEIASTGSPTTMNSSVVGKRVNVSGNINWTYDPKSTDASSGGGGSNPIPGYSDVTKPNFFNILSWQELSKTQVP